MKFKPVDRYIESALINVIKDDFCILFEPNGCLGDAAYCHGSIHEIARSFKFRHDVVCLAVE